MNPSTTDEPESDYGSELDFTDQALLAQLDGAHLDVIKSGPHLDNDDAGDAAAPAAQSEIVGQPISTPERASAGTMPQDLEIIEDKRSLWERYRKRRNWGALSVSDFAGPIWCEYAHTYRLASKSWLPPLERPAKITSAKGAEIVIDTKKTVKREKVLVKGTEVHTRIEKQVMGDVQQVKVETEGLESWWALRLLNTIVSLSILIEKGRVREVPVVGLVQDRLVFGVIDEIERREITVPTRARSTRRTDRNPPAASTSTMKPSSPKKTNASPSKTPKDQPTLLQFFSPSRGASKTPTESDRGTGTEKGKEKATRLDSDDLFRDLTQTDDEADLAALAEAEELEKQKAEAKATEGPSVRWGYVISDTKTRYNRSLPPEADAIPSKVQLMLYHELFESLMQPEPPPLDPPAPSEPHQSTIAHPFPWSKLYSNFGLDPHASLPASFLSAIEPVVQGSGLEELLEGLKTLGDFVAALGLVGTMLRGDRLQSVLEKEMEISYVLRSEEGGRWKGRRSAKKRKKKSERSTKDSNDDAQDSKAKDVEMQAGEPSSAAVSDKELEGAASSTMDTIAESQTPFLANPSLPLPFPLPPPLSQQSIGDDDIVSGEDVVLPLYPPPQNSQVVTSNEPRPAVSFSNGDAKRYNMRPRGSNAIPPTTPEPSQIKRKSTRSVSPDPHAPRERSTVSPRPPTLIGVSKFTLSLELLEEHVAKSMSYWNGERDPVGVSIENVKRCRTCEFEEGCEWREAKARESLERARLRRGAMQTGNEPSSKKSKVVVIESSGSTSL